MSLPFLCLRWIKANRDTLLIWGVIPIVLSIFAQLACRLSEADIAVARYFFDPAANEWRGNRMWMCQFLHDWGPTPGLMLAVAGGLFAAWSLFSFQRAKLRWIGLSLLLAYLIGPGLLVNGIIKPWCQRPRPRQLVEFGGRMNFVAVGVRGNAGHNSSFPSGHASSAFFLFTPALLYLGSGRVFAMSAWLIAGLLWGAFVGWARIAVGAHFVSDVLASATLVYAASFLTVIVLSGNWVPNSEFKQES